MEEKGKGNGRGKGHALRERGGGGGGEKRDATLGLVVELEDAHERNVVRREVAVREPDGGREIVGVEVAEQTLHSE